VTAARHDTCHHRAYGLSCADFEQLLRRANGRCELCSTPAEQTPLGKLIIDHEQRIGMHAVRGLLCPACNAHMRRVDSGERPMSWEVAAYVLLSGHVLPPGMTRQPSQPTGRRSKALTGNPRTVRIPQDVWDDFGAVCDQVESNRTEQVIGFMEWITSRPNAARPKRQPLRQHSD